MKVRVRLSEETRAHLRSASGGRVLLPPRHLEVSRSRLAAMVEEVRRQHPELDRAQALSRALARYRWLDRPPLWQRILSWSWF